MESLFEKLGVNWKLLFSQGVNFIILLTILTALVYKPLLKIMKERQQRIELGLKIGEEAEKRLNEIENIKNQKIAEADKKALAIIDEAQKNAKNKFQEIIKEANTKSENILSDAALVAEKRKQEALEKLTDEAKSIIKEAIVKTVELDPTQIDEKLINQAVETIKQKL